MSVMESCCTPLHEGPIDEEKAGSMATVLGALGDPVRLRIVSLLMAAPEGSLCGCDLEEPLDLSQPTVSHHMKILREAGLIEGERRGRWIHYRVVPQQLEEIAEALTPVPARA